MHRTYANVKKIHDTIGGKTYTFKSKFERDWAKYLQLLKEQGFINDWSYEPTKFIFEDETFGPISYTPDFGIQEDGRPVYFQECKGHFDSPTNTKFRRMAKPKHYPDIEIDLILQRFTKKNARKREIAAKYVRRVIDASQIFRQVKGLI